ncbi:tigger transposable element-derived protein 6-like [Ixodes scapularis]
MATRHGISYRQVNGEAASVNPADIENWIALLRGIVNAYRPCDVFNAHKLGLFYKVQPTKSLSLKGESCHGGKVHKDRITVLLCCNEDGSEMIKPWVIGKWKQPTCLRNIARLPCVYKQNTKAWMTCSLFEVLLRYLDGRLGCKDRKGLLFLDNCSAHPKDTSFLRTLRVVFLPANTTSHLQPLDAGIIKNVKHLYRKCIVRRFLARVSRGEDPGKLTLLDAMHYLNTSWESVSHETVRNCFRKCGFRRLPEAEESEPSTSGAAESCVCDDPYPCVSDEDDMDEELRSTGTDLAFSEFVGMDDHLATCDPQTVADIVAELRQGQVSRNDDDDDEEHERPQAATFAQAVAALGVLPSFFDHKDSSGAEKSLQTLEKELFFAKGWFGIRKDFCQFLLGACPLLQEYGNISYSLHNNEVDGSPPRETTVAPEVKIAPRQRPRPSILAEPRPVVAALAIDTPD